LEIAAAGWRGFSWGRCGYDMLTVDADVINAYFLAFVEA
jgi:hypothetical protein